MVPNRIVPPDRIARSQPADTLATSLKFTTMHHAHRAAFHNRPRMVCIVDLAGVIPVNILQRTIHYRVRGQCWSLITLNVIVDTIGTCYPRGMALRFHRHLRDLAENLPSATRKKTSESGLGPDLGLKCIPNECPPPLPAGAALKSMAPYAFGAFSPARPHRSKAVFNTPGAVDKWHGNVRDAVSAMRRQTLLAS
ncbi:hypothetical protein ALC62_13547 [Cyphomyrmex costatus]|uniref:Uncharacterized protein n=1 Tax=Cyphomyrmex costatus TaxID=456900 RepID=A0A151I9P6_9HYME|nr:hypothetical protein ALC62_13547 [Cyphomyrmex costatus]